MSSRVSVAPALFDMNIPEQLENFQSGRVSGLESLGDIALDGPVLLWRTWCIELAPYSETIAVALERSVGLLRPVVRAKNAWDTHARYETLHHCKDSQCALLLGPIWPLQT